MTPREIKQAQLSANSSGSPQLAIPKVPFIPLPQKVVSAFPEMKAWNETTAKANEEWRVKASIAVLGTVPN